MKFVCERCHTRYSIADEKVRQKILRIRCKTCGDVIVVHEAGEVPDAGLKRSPASSSPAARLQAAPPPPPLPLAPVAEWYVSVNGQSHGPFTRLNAARHVLTTRETDDVHVWKDGMSGWKPARDVSVIAREIRILRPPLDPPQPPSSPPPPPLPPAKPQAPVVKAVAKSETLPKPAAVVPLTKSSTIPLPFEAEFTVPDSPHAPLPAPEPAVMASATALPKLNTTPAPRASATALPKLNTTPAPRASATALPKLTLTPGPAAATLSRSTPAIELPKAKASSISLPIPTAPSEVAIAAPAADEDIFSGLTIDAELDVDSKGRGNKTSEPDKPHPALSLLVPPDSAVSSPDLSPPKPSTVPVPVLLPAPTTLFPISVSSAVTLPHAHAESGLSRMTGLAALAHRHQGLKYIIAGAAIVFLVIVLVILSLRGDSGKKADEQGQRSVATETKVAKSDDELAKELEAVVGKEDVSSPTKATTKTHFVKSPSRGSISSPSASAGSAKAAMNSDHAAAVRRMGAGGSELAPARPNPFATGNVKTVSQEQFTAVVKRNQGSVKICYERALKLDNQLTKGRIDVTVSVGLSGTVQKVLLSTPPGFYVIEACLKDAVRRWAFPASGEEYTMSFPLIMQGGM